MAYPLAFTPARIRRPSRSPGPRYPAALVRFALSKEALKTKLPTARPIDSAMKWTCSSLAMTQGPAIRTSGPRRKSANSIGTGILLLAELRQGGEALAAIFVSRADERAKQRMRFQRLGLELGMELAAEVPRVIGNL